MIFSARTELTAFDKTQTLSEWARETGIEVRSLKKRLERRAARGALTQQVLEDALSKKPEDHSAGARTRNMQRLMMAVESCVSQELLDKEVAEYVQAKGALSFFKEFKDFFPKGASVALDGATDRTTQQAARITIFNAPPPSDAPSSFIIDAE